MDSELEEFDDIVNESRSKRNNEHGSRWPGKVGFLFIRQWTGTQQDRTHVSRVTAYHNATSRRLTFRSFRQLEPVVDIFS